jgi:hypothetical protein
MINGGGSGCDLTEGIVPVFAWRECGRLQESSVRIIGLELEKRTVALSNTKLEC